GATIHDVAQVVGAGYAVSDEAGDTATIIKLFRVALLMPVLVLVGIAFSTRSAGSVMKGQSPLPWFGVVFFILVGVNSAGILPEGLRLFFVDVSRWCLICAVAAIGLTTSIEEMARLGWRALALPIGTTVAMMLLVIALLLTVGAGA
ncbi:MAG: putative sulfate exporter family transporter, partial [Pseudomonadota bacterium]